MTVIIIHNDNEFNGQLAHQGLVVVDFSATWCGPCKRIAPIFEQLSNEFNARGVKFVKVDVDDCSQTADKHHINSVPTFIFFRQNVPVARLQGYDPDGLKAKIKELSSK